MINVGDKVEVNIKPSTQMNTPTSNKGYVTNVSQVGVWVKLPHNTDWFTNETELKPVLFQPNQIKILQKAPQSVIYKGNKKYIRINNIPYTKEQAEKAYSTTVNFGGEAIKKETKMGWWVYQRR